MIAALKLTVGGSAIGALVNCVFGSLVAWTLVRYDFPGRRIVDALVDLPFALPTAVSGIALTAVYAPEGWIGRFLARAGIEAAFSPLGVVIALTFIGLPFVVRTLQPAMQDLEREYEEAAADLGAPPRDQLMRVVLPLLAPAIVASAAVAFALSIDDFVTSNFVAGKSVTFPLWVYGAVKVGIPPQVFVLGTAIFLAGLTLAVLALIFQGRSKKARQAPEDA